MKPGSRARALDFARARQAWTIARIELRRVFFAKRSFWVYGLAGWRPGLPMASPGALYQRATTMTLAGIVAAQVGNVLACRSERESILRLGLLSNRAVLLGMAAEVAILLALILIPPLATVFALAPLSFAEWAPLLGFPAVLLALEEGRKWAMRRASRRDGSPGRRAA